MAVKTRKQKISAGERKSSQSVKLTEIQKINMGGGMLRGLPNRWKISK